MPPGGRPSAPWRSGIAIGSGYLFPTTFQNEVYSDLTGERGILMGALAGRDGSPVQRPAQARPHPQRGLQRDRRRADPEPDPPGRPERDGLDVRQLLSSTAQRGALDWRHEFRNAVAPVFDRLYQSVVDGRRDPHRSGSQQLPPITRKNWMPSSTRCATPRCGRPARPFARCARKTGSKTQVG